jgi:hypothetical protein
MITVRFAPTATPNSAVKAVISFRPVTDAALDIIKAVPNARYNRAEKAWTIPAHRLPKVLQAFHAAGLKIEVNARAWTPPPPQPVAEGDSLVALFTDLPAELVEATALALARAWDANDVLMLRLHGALARFHESQPASPVRRLRARAS